MCLLVLVYVGDFKTEEKKIESIFPHHEGNFERKTRLEICSPRTRSLGGGGKEGEGGGGKGKKFNHTSLTGDLRNLSIGGGQRKFHDKIKMSSKIPNKVVFRTNLLKFAGKKFFNHILAP